MEFQGSGLNFRDNHFRGFRKGQDPDIRQPSRSPMRARELREQPTTPIQTIHPVIVYLLSPGDTEKRLKRPPKSTPPATPIPSPPGLQRITASGPTHEPDRDNKGGAREGEGRDRYMVGDRVWWSVPKLPEPDKDAAVTAADWIVQVTVIMADLSVGSKDWWALLVSEARAAYEGRTQTPAIERAAIRAIPSPELGSDKYSRL